MIYRFFIYFFVFISLAACSRYSKHEILQADDSNNAKDILVYLDELIKKDKTNYQIFFQRAKIYYDLKQYKKALEDIQKSLELNPTNEASYLLLAQVYQNQSSIKKSIGAALQAEQRGFRNYELYKLLALNYLKMGDAENAEKSIDRLLDFNLTAENLSLKGDIYLELKDTTNAVKSYVSALKLNNQTSRPYRSIYSIYEISRPDYAEEFLDLYLKVNPDYSSFLVLKGEMLLKRNEYDSAINYFTLANYKAFKDFQLLNKVASAYYNLENYDTAFIEVNESLKLDSVNNRDAKLLAARSLDKLRDYNLAKVYYEAIVKSDSTDVIALDELDKLNRKVAYLWRLSQQEKAFNSIRNSAPPEVERKDIN